MQVERHELQQLIIVHFSQHQVGAAFRDVPPIEIALIDRRDLPSAGAGETPIVCVAPAIGSAVRAFGAVASEQPVTLSK